MQGCEASSCHPPHRSVLSRANPTAQTGRAVTPPIAADRRRFRAGNPVWRISLSANRWPRSDQVRGHVSPGYALEARRPDCYKRAMTIRIRKLIGTAALLALVIVWALVAMAIAQPLLA